MDGRRWESALKNGEAVAAFERAFAEYVGAQYAIALCNGTATLHAALVALGVKPGDRVAVPPLTMASTTIAVLHAGAVPVFRDVDPDTWLMSHGHSPNRQHSCGIAVSLYGLHGQPEAIDDAAQTLRKHGGSLFTSYSFQASKILALGEGGMLVTDSEELATKVREFSSLGYQLDARSPRIDPHTLKSPQFNRHHSLGWNYRMNDLTAAKGLELLERNFRTRPVDFLLSERRQCVRLYRDAIEGCEWLTPQHVPDGWSHDYWTYAVATDTPERLLALLDCVEKHGGERPYACWQLTYKEPAFKHLALNSCPVAEFLQPRLAQFQTNNLQSAERNAQALRKAIAELSSQRPLPSSSPPASTRASWA